MKKGRKFKFNYPVSKIGVLIRTEYLDLLNERGVDKSIYIDKLIENDLKGEKSPEASNVLEKTKGPERVPQINKWAKKKYDTWQESRHRKIKTDD